MHFSAKRGLAIACRLSVCPSVTLVDCDHIGWNSSKIIPRLVSLRCSLSVDSNIRVYWLYSKGNTRKFWPKVTHNVNLSVGDIRSQIAAEWLQAAQRSQWRAYRKPPSLFRMVPSLIPYDFPFLQNRGSICPMIEWPYLRNGWSDTLHVWFWGRVFRVGGSNGAISSYIKSKLAAGRRLG